MRTLMVLALAALVFPRPAAAVITFTQLDRDTFVISHRIKIIGSRGRAQKLVYTKTASLCVAAGYDYFEILHQESAAGQRYEAANASIRVRYSREEGEDRIACERNADPQYIEQAREKLAKIGYEPPSESPEPPASEETATRTCTVEQISAMVKAGLSDEQIKAACPE